MARGKQPESVINTFVFQAMIIDYLEAKGIGQAEFARRIGVKPATLSLWLSDATRRPDAVHLFRAAYEMGVHPWAVMKAVGLPIKGPPPSDNEYRERTTRLLDKEPELEHAIHGLGLIDPELKASMLQTIEVLAKLRRNGQEPLLPLE